MFVGMFSYLQFANESSVLAKSIFTWCKIILTSEELVKMTSIRHSRKDNDPIEYNFITYISIVEFQEEICHK